MNEKAIILVMLASLVLAACNQGSAVRDNAPPSATASSAPVEMPDDKQGAVGGPKQGQTPAKVCTMDARLCPDGSYVSRNPANNCAFNPCPGEQN